MRREVRRILTAGVLSLLLGGGTTYGVAWWLMNSRDPAQNLGGPVEHLLPESGWLLSTKRRTGITWCVASALDRKDHPIPLCSPDPVVQPTWSLANRFTPDQVWRDPSIWVRPGWLRECAAGWPCLAVVQRVLDDGMSSKPVAGFDYTAQYRGVAFAFMPLWPEFVMDAGLYAVVWAGALWGVGNVRRRLRIRAGAGGTTIVPSPSSGQVMPSTPDVRLRH